ncbi:MAG TPA: uracil-DNA glycosylase [Pyrinomonadaceae bacterium]|nr:uracil-DNA glycosylase [Pyrinomonadaceae bacterium]
MNSEVSELLSDLKEQILYLRELGAENFAVDLPEIDDSKFNSQNSKPEVSAQKPERFVSPADIPVISTAEKPKTANVEANQARRSLLESTKLSRLPSLSNRNPAVSNFSNDQNNESREKEMPVKTPLKINEEVPSLFGDMTQTLPESTETIEDIRADIGNCTRCSLWEGRTKIVHSEGSLNARLIFVGEAPGANEDAEGRPFVGKAGQLLNKIIEGIGMKREDVFIGNVNRCRPPGNRTPTLPEAHTCRPFLWREIAVVRPKVIVVLGNTATQNLLDTKIGITKLRGEFQDYHGVKVMPTFHPAYLLRDPSKKRETWEDMKKVRDFLNAN